MRLPPSGWDDVAAQEWTASDAAHWSAIAMPTMSDMAAFVHQMSGVMKLFSSSPRKPLSRRSEAAVAISREAWI